MNAIIRGSLICALWLSVLHAAENPQNGAAPKFDGPWLMLHSQHFINPERNVVLCFERDPDAIKLVDLKEKTAKTLRTIPPVLLENRCVPEHALLTADGATIILDHQLNADESKAPNGRPTMEAMVNGKLQKAATLQRAIYVLGVDGKAEAKCLTTEGDFDEWSFDPKRQMIFTTVAEKNFVGVAGITLAGKRTENAGMRPFVKGAGNILYKGRETAQGGSNEARPAIMADGSVFTVSPNKQYFLQYVKNAPAVKPVEASAWSPLFKDKDIAAVAPTADGKGLIAITSVDKPTGPFKVSIGSAQFDNCQVYLLDKLAGGTWRLVGDIPPLYGHGNAVAACTDGSGVWLATIRKEGNSINGGFFGKVDFKTGKYSNVVTYDDVQEILKKK